MTTLGDRGRGSLARIKSRGKPSKPPSPAGQVLMSQSQTSPPWNYWHLEQDHSLLWGTSCARWDTEEHPWVPPTKCQQDLPPQVVQPKMSPNMAMS